MDGGRAGLTWRAEAEAAEQAKQNKIQKARRLELI
jgi:hypothetical protein